MMNVTTATKTIPPTTPPAMAPTFGPLDWFELVLVGSTLADWHSTCAQTSHEGGIWTHISSALQLSEVHEGFSVGHLKQRFWRKTVRRTFSTSLAVMADMVSVTADVPAMDDEVAQQQCYLYVRRVYSVQGCSTGSRVRRVVGLVIVLL